MAIFGGVRFARQRAAEISCTQNLQLIARALVNYESTHRSYPSPNAGGHSWRIRVTPYIDSSPLFNAYRFDEPWNGPNNSTPISRPLPTKGSKLSAWEAPPAFRCPRARSGVASYLMLVGEHAFGKPMGYRKLKEITDPHDSTIMILETNLQSIAWLEPVDLDMSSVSMEGTSVSPNALSLSSAHPRGPAALFADGKVFRIDPKIDRATLTALITIDGGEKVEREKLAYAGILSRP